VAAKVNFDFAAVRVAQGFALLRMNLMIICSLKALQAGTQDFIRLKCRNAGSSGQTTLVRARAFSGGLRVV
jgi:hypothetical protein